MATDWNNEAGSIDYKGNSIEMVRKVREILSKEAVDLERINSL